MAATIARPVPAELLRHLRRAHDYIDRHYRQSLDLEQIAQVAGISKFHLVRSFEATYGETPIRYLTRRRIERAQDLLRLRDRGVHGSRVHEPRFVLIAVHGSGWRESRRVSGSVGAQRRAPRARLLSVHARRAGSGGDSSAGSSNLGEAPYGWLSIALSHDHQRLTRHRLLPRPGCCP
jgi:AraC-like DNA-binding protein